MGLDAFFDGFPESRQLFDALRKEVDSLGEVELRVTRSQVALRRAKNFAWAWIPEKSLRRKAAPLVLSFGFRHRDPSPRWKEIVEPYRGRFTHHLELYSTKDIDKEVFGWLQAAWDAAG
jgi:hypothetical protein